MKRLYYIPGIISLILLPALFVPDLIKKSKENKQYVIEINYPPLIDKDHPDRAYNYYNGKAWWTVPKRNYKKYICLKHSKDNQNIIDEGIIALNTIYKNTDTINGVEFIIKDAYYKDLISILDNFLKNKIKYYLVLGDTVRSFYWPIDTLIKPKNDGTFISVCGTPAANYRSHLIESEKQQLQLMKEGKVTFIKARILYILIILGSYILLAVLTLNKLIISMRVRT